jgi:hypothetical protein
MAHTRPTASATSPADDIQSFLAAIFPRMSAQEGYEKLKNSGKKWLLRYSLVDGMLSVDYKHAWNEDGFRSHRLGLTTTGWVNANKYSELQLAHQASLPFDTSNAAQVLALQAIVEYYVTLYGCNWDEGFHYNVQPQAVSPTHSRSCDDPYERIEAFLNAPPTIQFFRPEHPGEVKPESNSHSRCSSPSMRNT